MTPEFAARCPETACSKDAESPVANPSSPRPRRSRSESRPGESWDNGKGNGNYYIVYRGYVGIMKEKMEAATTPGPYEHRGVSAAGPSKVSFFLELLWPKVAILLFYITVYL